MITENKSISLSKMQVDVFSRELTNISIISLLD